MGFFQKLFSRRWYRHMISRQSRTILEMSKTIHDLAHEKPDEYYLALTISINNSKFIIMDLVLNSNEFDVGALALFNKKTNELVAGVKFSEVTAQTDDDTVVKAVVLVDGDGNPTGNIKAVAVGRADGSPDPVDDQGKPIGRPANIKTTAKYTFTNTKGESSTGTQAVLLPVTVYQVVSADDEVELRVIWGAPQVQPPVAAVQP